MTLPKSSLAAQIVAAVVFVAFAAGVIAYARALRSVSHEAVAGAPGEPDAESPLPPLPPGVELTPKTARNAPEVFTALARQLGENARGMPCVVYVDYDRHADRLHVAFSLDHADPAGAGARPAALKRVRDILEAVHDGSMPWTWILVTGTAVVPDKAGAGGESTVLRAQFSRDRLKGVDWSRAAAGDRLSGLAQQYWLCLDLQK